MYQGSSAAFCRWNSAPPAFATNGFDAGRLFFGLVLVGSSRKYWDADARAAAPRLIAGAALHDGTVLPGACGAAPAAEERVVERVLQKLRELLCDRLDVGIVDHRGRRAEIRREDERIAGLAVHPVRSPGTADGGVAERVVCRIVGHREDQPALLFRDLAEDLALQPDEVHDGEGAAGFRGSEDVTRARRDRDLHRLDLGLGEERVPVRRVRGRSRAAGRRHTASAVRRGRRSWRRPASGGSTAHRPRRPSRRACRRPSSSRRRVAPGPAGSGCWSCRPAPGRAPRACTRPARPRPGTWAHCPARAPEQSAGGSGGEPEKRVACPSSVVIVAQITAREAAYRRRERASLQRPRPQPPRTGSR